MKVYASQKYVDDAIAAADVGIVKYTEQILEDEQKAQARSNIGAVKFWDELENKPFGEDADGVLTEFVLKSSTPDSIKKFKITVDDSGTITATEITE